MGTGSFPRVNSGRGVMLTPHPLLVPWSWKSRAIPLLPLWAVRPVQSLSACTRVLFTFILPCIFHYMYNEQTNAHLINKFLLYCSLFIALTCFNADTSSSGSPKSVPAKLHKCVHAVLVVLVHFSTFNDSKKRSESLKEYHQDCMKTFRQKLRTKSSHLSRQCEISSKIARQKRERQAPSESSLKMTFWRRNMYER